MSVAEITSAELANLAVVATGNTASDHGKRTLAWMAETLAEYSLANLKAMRHTYGPNEVAVLTEVSDILDFARRPNFIVGANRERALLTMASLAYNAVANDGTDFLEGKTAKGLLTLACRLLK